MSVFCIYSRPAAGSERKMRVASTITAILIASVTAVAAAPSELNKISCPDGRFTVPECCRRVDSTGKGFGCTYVGVSPKNNKEFKQMCHKLKKQPSCCANSLVPIDSCKLVT
ncbi:hypothetical protein DFH06DRAFT_1326377 [Mycena polygramma]|nr:hypothetical protein DFH06DRAFT_1326377 [Mycena polygramma]